MIHNILRQYKRVYKKRYLQFFLHVFSLNELANITKIYAKELSRIRSVGPAPWDYRFLPPRFPLIPSSSFDIVSLFRSASNQAYTKTPHPFCLA